MKHKQKSPQKGAICMVKGWASLCHALPIWPTAARRSQFSHLSRSQGWCCRAIVMAAFTVLEDNREDCGLPWPALCYRQMCILLSTPGPSQVPQRGAGLSSCANHTCGHQLGGHSEEGLAVETGGSSTGYAAELLCISLGSSLTLPQ